VFPVRYELDVYILFRRYSIFEGLRINTVVQYSYQNASKCSTSNVYRATRDLGCNSRVKVDLFLKDIHTHIMT
jgi:hypothetical protein